MTFTVVIPCLNEAGELARTLEYARRGVPDGELIVVDGGSTDDTVAIARANADSVVSSSKKQRAAQMNLGAEKAASDVFLFLHADTLLPIGAVEVLRKALQNGSVVGGGFARRFDSPSFFLRMTCALAAARCRAFGWFLGDQAIFVRRQVFQALGGFRPMDRFEDLDFARRMQRVGRVATVTPPVVSSARRFEKDGALRRTWQDLRLTAKYLKGDRSVIASSV